MRRFRRSCLRREKKEISGFCNGGLLDLLWITRLIFKDLTISVQPNFVMVKMKIKFQGKFLKEEVQVLFSFSQR